MTETIAIAGKGGVGKTTCAALLVRGLVAAGVKPVLAVDADPNANLHMLLGFPRPDVLGTIRDEALSAPPGGPAKEELIESLVQRRVAEGIDVDLVTMGRGEGPGCYCFVNDVLRRALSRLAGSYRAVVVDNEAGMEHLSRRNVRRIGHLVLVADPSPRGLMAAAAIRDLARELALPVDRTWILLNRAYGPGDGRDAGCAGIPVLAEVPHDPSLPGWEEAGRSFLDLPDSSPAARRLAAAARRLAAGDTA